MKERPILMTPENAQKVHDVAKTQTRRVLNPQLEIRCHMLCVAKKTDDGFWIWPNAKEEVIRECPYGIVGDRLWIRENGWERPYRTERMLRDGADTWEPFYYDALLCPGEAEELKAYGFKRRPSIHMPRWACRTVVEITDIRVERVQNISEDDARAEGCQPLPDAEIAARIAGDSPARMEFWALWKSINGPDSWERNEWVWVITFRKVRP